MQIGFRDIARPLSRNLAEAPFRAVWLGAGALGRAVMSPVVTAFDIVSTLSDTHNYVHARELPIQTPSRTVERVKGELATRSDDADPRLRRMMLAEGIRAALSAREVIEIPPSERRRLASDMLFEIHTTEPEVLERPSQEKPDKMEPIFGAEVEQLITMVESPEL